MPRDTMPVALDVPISAVDVSDNDLPTFLALASRAEFERPEMLPPAGPAMSDEKPAAGEATVSMLPRMPADIDPISKEAKTRSLTEFAWARTGDDAESDP